MLYSIFLILAPDFAIIYLEIYNYKHT